MSAYAHVIDTNLRHILESEPLETTRDKLVKAVNYSRNATANDADDLRLSHATYYARRSFLRRAEDALKNHNHLMVQQALRELWGI